MRHPNTIQGPLSSYVFKAFPDPVEGDLPFGIPVPSAERTFGEKAMILHAEFHRPKVRPVEVRFDAVSLP
jgi:hypothetical protein